MLTASAVDRWMFAPVPERHHRWVVVALAAVVGARLATHDYAVLADLPDAMFRPPWFLDWLGGPPPAAVLVGVQVVGVVTAVVTIGLRGRRVLPFAAAWAALVFLGGVETSAGKILHNDVLLLLASVPFLLPPVPSGTDRSGGPAVAGWHLRAAMVVVAIGYAAAGAMKLRHSGLAWVTSDNLRWVLYTGARRASTPAPWLARDIADHPWMATTVAAGTIGAELLFPLAVVSRRARPWLAGVVVGLHVGVFATLGLDYWTWVATVLVLFTPWVGRRGATPGPSVGVAPRT